MERKTEIVLPDGRVLLRTILIEKYGTLAVGGYAKYFVDGTPVMFWLLDESNNVEIIPYPILSAPISPSRF